MIKEGARVYEYIGNNWSQLGDDMVGETTFDSFGNSVSLSSDGTRLAIGARDNDQNGSNAGSAGIFSWNGSAWIRLGAYIYGDMENDQSGESVSLSSDGSTVAISSYAA